MAKWLVLACSLVSFAAGCSARESGNNEPPSGLEADQMDARRALARRWFSEVINERNLDVIADIYAADYVHHGPGGAEMRGLETVRAFAASIAFVLSYKAVSDVAELAGGEALATAVTFVPAVAHLFPRDPELRETLGRSVGSSLASAHRELARFLANLPQEDQAVIVRDLWVEALIE